MMAAQRDINGGFRVNVEAQVAERQLIQVLEDVISSSLKTCHVSLVVGLRTSAPIHTGRDKEEAERIIADRRQRVLHTMTRMNGARGMVETLAQKRLFIGSLPCMRKTREIDMLTLGGRPASHRNTLARHAQFSWHPILDPATKTHPVLAVRFEPQ
jgi:hypothetical protein